MNPIQKEIIIKLQDFATLIGHSPQRRELPSFALKCYKHFGSFNAAKIKAGLNIKNIKTTSFPANAFELDKDMASIASYVTFDGHLYQDLSGSMYSSKNIEDLKKFEKIVKRKFGLKGKYYLFSGGIGVHKTHRICFFNKTICKRLHDLEIPSGDKVTKIFNVPKWIYSSNELSREYLKIAFFCEGCFEKEKRRKPRITFANAKCEDLLYNGIEFVNQLRKMLKRFDIDTTEHFISGKRIRNRDGKISKDIRFRVKVGANNKFISEIGWLK